MKSLLIPLAAASLLIPPALLSSAENAKEAAKAPEHEKSSDKEKGKGQDKASESKSKSESKLESEQVTAVRSMHKMLAAGKFEEFHREWVHPHLSEQMDEKQFVGWMKSDKGKAVLKLFADVLAAIDSKASSDILVARPEADGEQDEAEKEKMKDKYEFILREVRKQSPTARAGAQWHLEIQLDKGKWKLMDVD